MSLTQRLMINGMREANFAILFPLYTGTLTAFFFSFYYSVKACSLDQQEFLAFVMLICD